MIKIISRTKTSMIKTIKWKNRMAEKIDSSDWLKTYHNIWKLLAVTTEDLKIYCISFNYKKKLKEKHSVATPAV